LEKPSLNSVWGVVNSKKTTTPEAKNMFQKNDSHLQQSFFNSINELPDNLQKRLEDSWSGAFYENVFVHIDEDAYSILYTDIPSRPNIPVNILVGLEILKAGNGWSDEELYDNACFNVQTRHALGLRNLGDAYFGMRTIYTFRHRLVKHMQQTGENLFEQTFEQITAEQLAAFSVKSNHQRVDSTQIASNIREMSRLQLLVEVLQRVHRMLSEADQVHWETEFGPYLKGTSGQYTYRLKGKEVYQPHLKAIGDLMHRLTVELAADYQEHETYQILIRVFDEHFNQSDDNSNPKDGSDLSAGNLQSPDDLEASYRRKRDEGYVGYVANITETSHAENKFQLVLKVQVEPNTTDDAKMLAEIVPELKNKYGLDLMNADGGYGSPDVDKLMGKLKIKLHQTALRGRQPKKGAFNLATYELELNPDNHTLLNVTAPDGTSLNVEPGRKSNRYILRVPHSETSSDPPSSIYISQQDVEVALRRQRCTQPNPDGKNPRAAIESTIGVIKRPFGNDKAPVRGKFRMGTMVIGSAMMVNLRRIQRFQTEQRRKTRKNAKECATNIPLFLFFSHALPSFFNQFYSVTRFLTLHC
jgi:hypothetical protein